jgi:hypothetical protein
MRAQSRALAWARAPQMNGNPRGEAGWSGLGSGMPYRRTPGPRKDMEAGYIS